MLKITVTTCLKESHVQSAEVFVNLLESKEPGLMLKTASAEYWCSPDYTAPWLEVLGLQFDQLYDDSWGLSPVEVGEAEASTSEKDDRATVSRIVSAGVALAVSRVEACESAEVLREVKNKERRYKNRVTVIRAVDARIKALESAPMAKSALASMGRLR